MQLRFGAGPEPRSFRKIQGGDAAKAAEESAQEPVSYQRSFGISLRATSGARFELEQHPSGPGEAGPVPASDSGGQNTPAETFPPPTEESSSSISKKLFRKLFHP